MFIYIVIFLFAVSFIGALISLKDLKEKPKIGRIKKSLHKDKIVFLGGHSSSKE